MLYTTPRQAPVSVGTSAEAVRNYGKSKMSTDIRLWAYHFSIFASHVTAQLAVQSRVPHTCDGLLSMPDAFAPDEGDASNEGSLRISPQLPPHCSKGCLSDCTEKRRYTCHAASSAVMGSV